MIPVIFPRDTTNFTTNGIGRIVDCTECIVTEERNGIFECEFSIPVSSKMFPKIEEGMIIYCTHDDLKEPQPFDIYARSEPIDEIVTFYAHHISYRLMNVILKPFEASNLADAMRKMKTMSINDNPFTFWTDKEASAKYTLSHPASVKTILGGEEGSIIDNYSFYRSAEYKWDKFTVRLYTNRGRDNGVEIRYGKNLIDYTRKYDESGIYNAVVPYYEDVDGNILTLPEWVVYAEGVDSSNAIIVPMNLSDQFDEMPSEDDLRDLAYSLLNRSGAWIPDENIEVNFIDLRNTEDYKNVAPLERVSLCDTVSVIYPKYHSAVKKVKVIKTEYDVLLERYNKIELGKPKASFSEAIKATTKDLIKDLPSRSILDTAIKNATDIITGANAGYLRDIFDANGNRIGDVIMDTNDIATARKVWRRNLGGFGYSSNGYNGPFDVAITMDGSIVADFITTGTLDAAQVNVINIDASKITVGTLPDSAIADDSVTLSKLNSDTKSKITQSSSIIYHSVAENDSAPSAPTAWVSSLVANQNVWTQARPQYSRLYPKLYTARQTRTVDGSYTCTTPIRDRTTTVIDGGNIITGTIDATKLTVDDISALGATIGGWGILGSVSGAGDYAHDKISKRCGNYEVFLYAPESPQSYNAAIGVKDISRDEWMFYVEYDGSLYAKDAVIAGSITATSGDIGNLPINSSGNLTGITGTNINDTGIPSEKLSTWTQEGIGGGRAYNAATNGTSYASYFYANSLRANIISDSANVTHRVRWTNITANNGNFTVLAAF